MPTMSLLGRCDAAAAGYCAVDVFPWTPTLAGPTGPPGPTGATGAVGATGSVLPIAVGNMAQMQSSLAAGSSGQPVPPGNALPAFFAGPNTGTSIAVSGSNIFSFLINDTGVYQVQVMTRIQNPNAIVRVHGYYPYPPYVTYFDYNLQAVQAGAPVQATWTVFMDEGAFIVVSNGSTDTISLATSSEPSLETCSAGVTVTRLV